MNVATKKRSEEPWRRRLYLPCYQVNEAAKYAHISTNTVANWHRKVQAGHSSIFPVRKLRTELSYLQLVEVAVVAAFRKAGLTLKVIREAREYMTQKLKSEFPFAEYVFKTDGKELLIDYAQIEKKTGGGTLLALNRKGQLGWESIITRLEEFEYENKGMAIRWHLAGKKSAVIIDPRISFGAPSVFGTPTWVVKGRWDAGESIKDIAYDFGISKNLVENALTFEGIQPN